VIGFSHFLLNTLLLKYPEEDFPNHKSGSIIVNSPAGGDYFTSSRYGAYKVPCGPVAYRASKTCVL
jgi:hypothetical protein